MGDTRIHSEGINGILTRIDPEYQDGRFRHVLLYIRHENSPVRKVRFHGDVDLSERGRKVTLYQRDPSPKKGRFIITQRLVFRIDDEHPDEHEIVAHHRYWFNP